MNKVIWNRFWRDKEGKVVVWQRPNWLLWAWIVSTVGSRLIDGGGIDELLRSIAFASIVVWACLEIVKGDSYFRRLLGAVVLILTIVSRLK